jgi:long-chain acyl-CoA synthetase
VSDSKPLSARLRTIVALEPERAAIVSGGESFSWGYLGTAITQLEELCAPLGGAGRHRVGIVLRNRAAHAAAIIATVASGRCVITMSAAHGPVALLEDIRELRPSVIAAGTEDWRIPGFIEAVREIGALPIELTDQLPDQTSGANSEGPLRIYADCPLPATVATEAADDVAILMQTSGTTGRPKRVPLTYEGLTTSFESSGLNAGPSKPAVLRSEVQIVWSPFVHIGGMYFILANVLEGKTTALMERFNVDEWVKLVRAYPTDVVSLVPTALSMVLAANVPADVFTGVKAVRSGTAPLKPEMAEEFLRRYGIPVLGNYGATEFAGAVTRWTMRDWREHGESKRGSVGRGMPGVEMRVVDPETQREVPPGDIGVLHVRSSQLAVADADGWARTTDLASIDADGFVFIHGRADDAVIRGGFKIVPVVVEDALKTHPAVFDAAMTGVPHDRLGAVPVAAVQLKAESDGEPPSEADLIAWLDARLPRYQVPVAVRIVDELPRTPSMKISKPALRALFEGVQLGD